MGRDQKSKSRWVEERNQQAKDTEVPATEKKDTCPLAIAVRKVLGQEEDILALGKGDGRKPNNISLSVFWVQDYLAC